MISNQIIQNNIEELKGITKVDFSVFDTATECVASTMKEVPFETSIIDTFVDSKADSQIVSGCHFLKIMDEHELAYVLIAKGFGDDAYMIGKIAVCQIQNLIVAYKERFDRMGFFQNLLLDNLLLVDIHNRATKLHIESEKKRLLFRYLIQCFRQSPL